MRLVDKVDSIIREAKLMEDREHPHPAGRQRGAGGRRRRREGGNRRQRR
jgi:hypothetical protein